jgi:hypothetical protein
MIRFGTGILAVALLLVCVCITPALAGNITFSDMTFNLADYSVVGPTFTGNADSSSQTYSQCPSCGNPGKALQIIDNFTLSANESENIYTGFINNTFLYNPAAEGAIISINGSVSKNATYNLTATGTSGTATFTNTFRPLILQGGTYYAAAIPGPSVSVPFTSGVPASGSSGYNTISSVLTATSFDNIDFSTGTFGTSHPDFSNSGAPMEFGLMQFSGAIFSVPASEQYILQYDNLNYSLSATPEPSSLALLGLMLPGALGFARRRNKQLGILR